MSLKPGFEADIHPGHPRLGKDKNPRRKGPPFADPGLDADEVPLLWELCSYLTWQRGYGHSGFHDKFVFNILA